MNTQTELPGDVQKFLHRSPVGMIIDGKQVPAADGKNEAVINPSDGSVLTSLASGNERDVDLAVAAARKSWQEGWRDMLPAAREAVMRRFGALIETHQEELAWLESLDNGKPVHHTKQIDVRACAGNLYHAAGLPTKIRGEVPSVSIPGHMAYTVRQPLGVVAIILPWNYPLIHCMQKAGPAMACGNSVVIKPASVASLAVVRLGELAMEAGIPAGVFNVVTGPGSVIGKALASHEGVNKVQMTGSTGVGKGVIAASAGNIKRLALELGSKAPNIIFEDADLEEAIPGAFEAAFGHSGQSCVAGCRLYVHSSLYPTVLLRLVEMTREIRPGCATDEETTMGPMVSREQYDTVMAYIEEGKACGAKLECGGKPMKAPRVPEGGYYIEPTIFTGAPDDARISIEEIFGPVLAVYPFDTEEEVIRRANNTTYGLAAGIWTRDIARAHRVAGAIESGVVWINSYDKFQPTVPFGGFKQSGYGRDNGFEAVEAFTEVKSIWIKTR